MINAFHSNWTTPFFSAKNQKKYFINDFEILTTILSALKWREYNGSIKMVTDSIGKAYYEYLGLTDLWDLGIETTLDDINHINSKLYWAAGKIYSLQRETSPIVMMDTDFIVWNKQKFIVNEDDIFVIHKEELNNSIYPPINKVLHNNTYELNPNFDYTVLPCNTSFVYVGNSEFKDYYTKASIDFMENVNHGNDRIVNMVFAEQRLFSLCANYLNLKVNSIYNLDYLSKDIQKDFTHIWGLKIDMLKNNDIRREFCIRCITRNIKDYPEYNKILQNIVELKKYFKEL